jgi:transposase
MANHLKMNEIESIRALYARGWSRRRIARELGLHRETVNQYVASFQGAAVSKPAKVTLGKLASQSLCRGHHEFITAEMDKGLTGQRIWQDLKLEHGFTGSYQSVKRYVHRLLASQPRAVCRMETLPGEEAQVDFGTGYWLVGEGGRKRKVHILRVVLSCSRKSYSEGVLRQDSETFLRCLENAFRYFGGVPATINLDNLKAAVIQADWFDPELNPKLADFARHYGTVILPTRPRRPEHKGKVEAGVKYVQNNALKGRGFEGLQALNRHLRWWEETVADGRIHGTTRRQVRECFEEEKPHLKALPPSLFPCYQEGRRQVHRDSFVEVERAYYLVPSEYLRRTLWVRWDVRMVRVFNEDMEPVVSHVRLNPGQFTKALGAQGRPCASVEESQKFYAGQAAKLGASAGGWAEGILERKGPLGIRVIQGLLGLSRYHASSAIDAACRKALDCGQWQLKNIKAWLDQPEIQPQTFSFLEVHPLIRDMEAYAAGAECFEENPTQTQTTPVENLSIA